MTQADAAAGDLECDVLIVGSGAGALCAALTAREAGLEVIILEKESKFGGASARSGGGVWIPGNRKAAAAGIADTREAILTYLRHETGARFDEKRVTAFLDHGPEMVDFVEARSPLRFQPFGGVGDYHPLSPGGRTDGRALMPEPLDAACLGKEIYRLREPLAVSKFLGKSIGTDEIRYFATAGYSVASQLRVVRSMVRHGVQSLFGRGQSRLSSGNALVGGLAAACFARGVRLVTAAPVHALVTARTGVTGAVAEIGGKAVAVRARRGVILATGGFPHDGARRAQLFPTGAARPEVWGLMPYGNSGDGLRMAEQVGAAVLADMKSSIAMAPAARTDRREGELCCFPVFGTRASPGTIAVRRDGRRFTNEAASYHDFCAGLLAASGDDEAACFLIADRRALRRYGLGNVHPMLPLRGHLRAGNLIEGRTLRELAENAGIDPQALEQTVAAFNRHAERGEDPVFGRGTSPYDRAMGDATHAPNPCLGALRQPPFFAIRVFAASVGTFAGLAGNEHGQVLRADGAPIAGLYATGNDLATITGGDYIGGGCTLGPAMTFGFIAARHIAASAGASR